MNKKLIKELEKNIRVIPNFPKKGILFQDVTSITDNGELFKKVIIELSKYVKENKVSKVAGIEARGFIFGSAVATQCNLPFIPIRKKGKLPGTTYSQKYKLEYGEDEIQVHKNAASTKDRILIIDDLIATGGTANAAAYLMNKFKPKELLFHFIIDLNNLGGFKKIQNKFKANSFLKSVG
jgi:adenine phosphoribosyltransferase